MKILLLKNEQFDILQGGSALRVYKFLSSLNLEDEVSVKLCLGSKATIVTPYYNHFKLVGVLSYVVTEKGEFLTLEEFKPLNIADMCDEEEAPAEPIFKAEDVVEAETLPEGISRVKKTSYFVDEHEFDSLDEAVRYQQQQKLNHELRCKRFRYPTTIEEIIEVVDLHADAIYEYLKFLKGDK